MAIEQMTNFPKYYCNENGWLFKKDAKTGRLMAKSCAMKFPHGKYPYYIIQQNGKKYILFVSDLHKDSPMIEMKRK